MLPQRVLLDAGFELESALEIVPRQIAQPESKRERATLAEHLRRVRTERQDPIERHERARVLAPRRPDRLQPP